MPAEHPILPVGDSEDRRRPVSISDSENGTSAAPFVRTRRWRDDEWFEATEATVLGLSRSSPNHLITPGLSTPRRQTTQSVAIAAIRTDSRAGGSRLPCEGLWLTHIPDNAVLSLDLTPDAEIFPMGMNGAQIEHAPISQRFRSGEAGPACSSTARGRPLRRQAIYVRSS
jgi:hypothetical protein